MVNAKFHTRWVYPAIEEVIWKTVLRGIAGGIKARMALQQITDQITQITERQ